MVFQMKPVGPPAADDPIMEIVYLPDPSRGQRGQPSFSVLHIYSPEAFKHG